MSDTNNPYQTPLIDVSQTKNPNLGKGEVSPETVAVLTATKIWVQIMGAFGFLIGALMIIAGLFIMFSGIPLGPIAIIYVFMSILYFIPAYYLIAYGSAIKNLELNPTFPQLNIALRAQKAFWKFVALTLIIVFAVYILLLIPLAFSA